MMRYAQSGTIPLILAGGGRSRGATQATCVLLCGHVGTWAADRAAKAQAHGLPPKSQDRYRGIELAASEPTSEQEGVGYVLKFAHSKRASASMLHVPAQLTRVM